MNQLYFSRSYNNKLIILIIIDIYLFILLYFLRKIDILICIVIK